MDRTYLYVPPEEKAEVQSLGAHWDSDRKSWYIGPEESSARFSKWLPPFEDEEGDDLNIVSDQAYIASTTVPCHRCHTNIEVICIHCESGTVQDEPLTRFTVSDIWAMDEHSAQQLQPWPNFHKTRDPDGEEGDFANHCPHCGATQEDLYLHSEPDHPFFYIPDAPAGSIKLTLLEGTLRLAGSEHFSIE